MLVLRNEKMKKSTLFYFYVMITLRTPCPQKVDEMILTLVVIEFANC